MMHYTLAAELHAAATVAAVTRCRRRQLIFATYGCHYIRQPFSLRRHAADSLIAADCCCCRNMIYFRYG